MNTGFMEKLANWSFLAWTDIEARYRRSRLGPFWISLSALLSTVAISYVYGILFKQPLRTFFPYVALGIVLWQFISGSMVEVSAAIVANRALLLGSPITPSWLCYRIVFRNLLILGHTLLVVIPILAFLAPSSLLSLPISIAGLLLVSCIVWSWGTSVAILSIRVGDLPQLINAAIGLLFLVTPVLWSKEFLGQSGALLTELNPFAHMLVVVRAPIVGEHFHVHSWLICFLLAVIGLLTMIKIQSHFKSKFMPWL
jgi:lipopolysaccharide transport system permease protein